MLKLVFKTALALICLLLAFVFSIAFYNSGTGVRLRAQLGHTSGQYLYATQLYETGEIGNALITIEPAVATGYIPALMALCDIMNDYQAIAPNQESCVSLLEQTLQKRLSTLTEAAFWSLEWDAADELLSKRLAEGDLTAYFDRARSLVLKRPDILDVSGVIQDLQKANVAQDPRGQYAYVVATINAANAGALSPVLLEVLNRRPSIKAGDAYFELAKLIQIGAISSDLDYITILMRSHQLGNIYAAGYLAQYYLANPEKDQTGTEQPKWLEIAANYGDAVAQFNIALDVINNQEGERPLADAVALLDRSAGAGFVPAQTLLGVTLWKNPNLMEGSEEEVRQRAVDLMQSAAEKQDLNAMFNLGSILVSQGKIEQAVAYLTKAAALGHVPAQSMLNELGATQ